VARIEQQLDDCGLGLSKMEIMRCLKRYLAREVYRALRADLEGLRGA